ncbi:MAG: hypothetical protein RLZZ385_1003 [Pseudomonadota bacterium]|jgi:RND family efflux transporter MFP subunit
MKFSQALLMAALIGSRTVAAQDVIPLSDEDIQRLAIIFASVTAMDNRSGNRFPGVVVYPPDSISNVAAPFAGVLERWHVTPGSEVDMGSMLATIRSSEILDAQNTWLTARLDVEQARFAVQRDSTLFESGIIARQRLVESQTLLAQQEVLLHAAAEVLGRAGFSAGDMERLVTDRGQLGRYVLRSPAAGTVTHRAVTAGAYLEPYADAAAVQGQTAPWLSLQIPGSLANRLVPGHTLTLLDADVTLTVRQFDREVDESTQTAELLAEFDAPVDYLPGQVLAVLLPPMERGLLVPNAAVVHSGNETTVFVRRSDGVEARQLRLIPAGNNYLATEGLRDGELVVVQGAAVLKGIQLGLGQTE